MIILFEKKKTLRVFFIQIYLNDEKITKTAWTTHVKLYAKRNAIIIRFHLNLSKKFQRDKFDIFNYAYEQRYGQFNRNYYAFNNYAVKWIVVGILFENELHITTVTIDFFFLYNFFLNFNQHISYAAFYVSINVGLAYLTDCFFPCTRST